MNLTAIIQKIVEANALVVKNIIIHSQMVRNNLTSGIQKVIFVENGSLQVWSSWTTEKRCFAKSSFTTTAPDYPAEGLIRVVKNGKIGFADAKTYALVIEPQFDCAFPFENGKAKVSKQCKTVKDGEYSVWESEAWQYVDRGGRF